MFNFMNIWTFKELLPIFFLKFLLAGNSTILKKTLRLLGLSINKRPGVSLLSTEILRLICENINKSIQFIFLPVDNAIFVGSLPVQPVTVRYSPLVSLSLSSNCNT